MRSGTAHLQLAIEVDSDPITGSITNGHHGAQSFTGWIELTEVIEAARKCLGSHPGANPEDR